MLKSYRNKNNRKKEVKKRERGTKITIQQVWKIT